MAGDSYSGPDCWNNVNINKLYEKYSNEHALNIGKIELANERQPQQTKPESKSMFKSIATDVKSFVIEHRSIIYFIAAALLIDHFVFKGAFKTRLQAIAERIVKKVEDKVA